MSKAKNFQWQVGKALPSIEDHTERKLEVIEQYLKVYFDTVTVSRRMDNLNITIVDGFCGGGLYQKGKETRIGSPFVLLQAVEDAKIRINQNRSKPLEIRARFYFSDLEKFHMEALKEALIDSPFRSALDDSIILQTGKFEELLPNIIADINKRHRIGRSIFLLDQCGYSDVPMTSLKQIFASLDKPEAILTFSIDALLNYLRTDGEGLKNLRQFGVSDEFVLDWHSRKEDDTFGRHIAQRTIMQNVRLNSGANFFTPFMLYSKTDKRWMFLGHLSKHQAARDKMLSVHWEKQNLFRHIGRGSLFELGFDHRLNETKDALFSFQEEDEKTLMAELKNELPSRIVDNMTDGVLSIDRLLSNIGNHTAAQNKMIFKIIQLMASEGDIEISKLDGKKKRPSTKVEVSDMLIRSNQPSLFSLVR